MTVTIMDEYYIIIIIVIIAMIIVFNMLIYLICFNHQISILYKC